MDDVGTLNYRLATLGVGGTAKLGIVRDGKQYQTTIKLEAAPETVPRAEITISGALAGAGRHRAQPVAGGRRRDALSRATRPASSSPASSGNSPAQVAGLQRGDVIVKLNDVAIDSTRQLARVAGQETNFWDLIIDRGGQMLHMQFRS